ncbi:hypothetical protein QF028_004393 [Neobacillus sp. B4I6]|uniref:hypothetical protein n=1 Tax=Neobacillus sp. B4I6 TaxID=3373925 RepID=UPI003D2568BB
MADYLNDYQKLMVEVRTELHHRPDLHDKVKGYIEELEQQKKNSQDQYIETFNRLEKVDYELTSLKKANEHVGNTVKLYEKENKALRDLVSLWI